MRAALLLVVVTACANRPTLRDPHAGELSLTFHNASGTSVCAIHLWPTSADGKGDNVLAQGAELASGASIELWRPVEDPPRVYQLEATGCPYEKVQVSGYVPSLMMNVDGYAVLFDEGTAASATAANELAHAHDNTTRVPAKFSKNAHPTKRPPAGPAHLR